MNSTSSQSLPEDVRNLILRKLRHQRRMYQDRLIGVTSRAYDRLRKEILANLQAGKPEKALVSVPLDVYREIATEMTAITKEWPGLVWQTFVSTLGTAQVGTCSSSVLNTLVDEYSWAIGQHPFTIDHIDPQKFKEVVGREASRYGVALDDFATSFDRNLGLAASGAQVDIINTARRAREEVGIAIDEYVIARRRSGEMEDPKSATDDLSHSPMSVDPNNAAGVFVECLPNAPEKPNEWLLAIKEMVLEFYKEYGRCPTRVEAWARLRENPPKSYGIKPSARFPDAICMGDESLKKRAFFARWSGYIDSKKHIKTH